MADLNYTDFIHAIAASDHIALAAPGMSDGDSVGTQCALLELLLQLFPAKKMRIINEDPCPKRYHFLPLAKRFEVVSDVLALPRSEWPQTMICVDGGAERLGPDSLHLWKHATNKGQVDHHAVGGGQNDYNFRLYDPKAAATTEIIYRLAKAKNLKLTSSIAQAIYLGLIHDTGMFKHSNTSPEILRIAADLLQCGFNHTETAEKGLLVRSQSNLKMIKEVINNIHFDLNERYVWGVLDCKSIAASGADAEEREGLIDLMFLTPRCEIAALYTEVKPDQWRISFRSRGWNVAALAHSLNVTGGGHVQAAGVNLEGKQAEVLNRCHEKINTLIHA